VLVYGANRDLHTVSLGRVLVHAPLRSRLRAGFPRECLAPPEAGSLFRTHHRSCQNGSYSELACPPTACLATCCGAQARCVRPTSASSCFDYEHPCLVSYRHLFETYAPPLNSRACTRSQETGGPGVSRRPIRFGEPPQVIVRRVSSARSRLSQTSDTPVATRRYLQRDFTRCVRFGRPRPLPSFLREDETN
jgi:hypothetical protein